MVLVLAGAETRPPVLVQHARSLSQTSNSVSCRGKSGKELFELIRVREFHLPPQFSLLSFRIQADLFRIQAEELRLSFRIEGLDFGGLQLVRHLLDLLVFLFHFLFVNALPRAKLFS